MTAPVQRIGHATHGVRRLAMDVATGEDDEDPSVGLEFLAPPDVAAPLALTLDVMASVVLDRDLELRVRQVDAPTDVASVVPDRVVDERLGKSGTHEQQPRPALVRRLDPGTDEAEALGIHLEPSLLVSVPRVAQSPASIECRLHSTHELGDSTIVLGDVLAVTVRSEALAADGLPDIAALRPVSRLGRNEWGHPPEVFTLDRPQTTPPS